MDCEDSGVWLCTKCGIYFSYPKYVAPITLDELYDDAIYIAPLFEEDEEPGDKSTLYEDDSEDDLDDISSLSSDDEDSEDVRDVIPVEEENKLALHSIPQN